MVSLRADPLKGLKGRLPRGPTGERMAFRRLRVETAFQREPLALAGLNNLEKKVIDAAFPPRGSSAGAFDESHSYKTQTIIKRDGSKRFLSVPSEKLREFQRKLLTNFFKSPELLHAAAFAYVPGRSAVQCARVHSAARWLIKIDLEDFFHSIDDRQLNVEFRRRGVEERTREALVFLVTRSAEHFDGPLPKKYSPNWLGSRHRFLPQGSATSGFLSNLVFYDMDCAFDQKAKELSLSYSRYADDLIFSSTQDFSRELAEKAMRELVRTLEKNGFRVNRTKTRIIPPGARKQVLGVLVGTPGIRLPKPARQRIDTHLWAIRKYGFTSHCAKVGFRNEYSLLSSLHGYLVWALSVDHDWARPRLDELVFLAEEQLGTIKA